VVEVNERQKSLMVAKAKTALKSLKGKRVAVLGLTFKPNTDDIREAPALDIMAGLLRAGASITAYDPMGMPHVGALPIGRRIAFADDAYSALDGADCAMLITEWNEFRTLDLKAHEEAPAAPGAARPAQHLRCRRGEGRGLTYVGVGQGATPRKKGTR
jgi:UDPglucose 6-dehydrogenase